MKLSNTAISLFLAALFLAATAGLLAVAIEQTDREASTGLHQSSVSNVNASVEYVYSWENGARGLTNWDSYTEIADPEGRWVGTGECGGEEITTFNKQVQQNVMYALMLPGDLRIFWTPNYNYWTNEEFMAWSDDPTKFCAVGGRYPLAAIDHRLLWVESCGGVETDTSELCAEFQEKLEGYISEMVSN